jgi:hypothetical protein
MRQATGKEQAIGLLGRTVDYRLEDIGRSSKSSAGRVPPSVLIVSSEEQV